MKNIIAPSILGADFSKLGESFKIFEDSGIRWVHLDIMDGHFVPNLSFGPPVIASLRKKTKLFFDVHLMVQNPEKIIDDFILAGADAITVHVEACTHLQRDLQTIRAGGKMVGVALNPATSLSTLDWVLDDIDFVLLMSVNPGFGGQSFLPGSMSKIKKLKQLVNSVSHEIRIAVDGGVCEANIDELKKAGVEIFVIGSALFKGEDLEHSLKKYLGYFT